MWHDEESIREARRLLGDDRLVNFLKEIGQHGMGIVERLANGESLDAQFYTGGQFGLTLFASRCDDVLETYEIEIGDLVAPMAGLGTIWHVMFNDDGTVDWVSHVGNWFS